MTLTVARLARYPVKSFQGEYLERAEVGPNGLLGDRGLAVVAADTGEVLSAKRTADLLSAEARSNGNGVEVRLPGGDWQPAPSSRLDEQASVWLGREVQVVPPVTGQSGLIRMSFNLDNDDEEVFEFPSPPGSFFDFAAVHLLTTASLRAAAALYPAGAWAVERFRPTILVDAPDDEFAEDEWVGSRLRLGGVELEVLMPTIRCAMPTRAQGDLPRDLDVVKTLNRAHEGNLGVYASVITPGTVSVGDELSVL